jgi:hypothetical protein
VPEGKSPWKVDMTAPPRRWFRFSLRTTFVVLTIFGGGLGWIGWQTSIVQERASVREWLRVRRGAARDHLDQIRQDPTVRQWDPPLVRQWFGDYALAGILLPPDCTDIEAERVKAAFSEASILRRKTGGGFYSINSQAREPRATQANQP